jgi:hypothetical protein
MRRFREEKDCANILHNSRISSEIVAHRNVGGREVALEEDDKRLTACFYWPICHCGCLGVPLHPVGEHTRNHMRTGYFWISKLDFKMIDQVPIKMN